MDKGSDTMGTCILFLLSKKFLSMFHCRLFFVVLILLTVAFKRSAIFSVKFCDVWKAHNRVDKVKQFPLLCTVNLR